MYCSQVKKKIKTPIQRFTSQTLHSLHKWQWGNTEHKIMNYVYLPITTEDLQRRALFSKIKVSCKGNTGDLRVLLPLGSNKSAGTLLKQATNRSGFLDSNYEAMMNAYGRANGNVYRTSGRYKYGSQGIEVTKLSCWNILCVH